MKSEQEFLASMWAEISAKECEANQKLIAHAQNKRLFIKEIFAYGMILALLAAGGLLAFLIKDNPDIVYIIAVFLFTVAFFAERMFYSKSQGVSIYENRNHS